ncbi:hypothetical protein [Mycoplasma seminis]|uniref:Uncharacterized protein n=1 Tax=Mycoplasma seminis TaxID=512749 RepID=A0ABY9H9F7_9MOLU|nr:hypothetical protein [Mycoplasma seminis]WLP85217.1 hypothetical protein Q8852_02755 [Mycoplasma seminis]
MYYKDIVEIIENELLKHDYIWEKLGECKNNKITSLDNKNIPYSNLIIHIKAPIDRIIFFSFFYQHNVQLYLNPDNKNIVKRFVDENNNVIKSELLYDNWSVQLPNWLSKFPNSKFVILAPSIEFEHFPRLKAKNNWMKCIRAYKYDDVEKFLISFISKGS